MKNLLFILGVGGTLLASCSSSVRTGYTYYDDVYDNRPSYSEEKRRSTAIDDRPSYQPSNTEEYNRPGNYDSDRYYDDEQSYYSGSSGTYTERLRRFSSPSSGFDYYSPYYTGFNDGFNYGIGIGTSYGFSNFGRWGSSYWNPLYSSSLYFGWGRPSWSIGFNTWYTPTYFDPFYGSSWGWGRPWNTSYYGGWGSPWGWGGYYSGYYGGGYYYPIDKNPKNNNTYYGPRGGSYGNTYYNGSQYGGGKYTPKNGSNNNQVNPTPAPSKGNMKYTPKSTPNTTPKNPPVTNPNRNNNNINIPQRYNTPSSTPSNNNRSTPNNNNSGGQKSGGSMQRTNK